MRELCRCYRRTGKHLSNRIYRRSEFMKSLVTMA